MLEIGSDSRIPLITALNLYTNESNCRGRYNKEIPFSCKVPFLNNVLNLNYIKHS